MAKKMIKNLQIFILFLALPILSYSQKVNTINWLNFEQLEDSLARKPKKTFIYFYADWCVYCKKMEQNAFKNAEIMSTVFALGSHQGICHILWMQT